MYPLFTVRIIFQNLLKTAFARIFDCFLDSLIPSLSNSCADSDFFSGVDTQAHIIGRQRIILNVPTNRAFIFGKIITDEKGLYMFSNGHIIAPKPTKVF